MASFSISTAPIDVQHPLPADGDSVYVKDIDVANITKVGWTGNVEDLFICPHTTPGVYNDTATNPKIIYIPFCRTLYLNAIGLGCRLSLKYFSNVKIEFIGSDGTVRYVYDDEELDSTKRGTRLYSFTPTACVGIKLYFSTANTDVGLTNITIQKETAVVARIRGLLPDNTIGDVGVTYGKALKSSISDDLDFPCYNTPTGDLRVIEPVRLIGAGYEGTTIDPRFWKYGATGTAASITQAGCELVVASGTSNAAYVYAYSVRRARYVSGSSMKFRCVGKLGDTGTANNKRRWGLGRIANYLITISSATVVAGDVYTNNSQTFVVLISGTTASLYAYGTGDPGAGAQTYTKFSGSGPATLTGSAFAATVKVTDGAWFQLDGTEFSIVTCKGGSETKVIAADFNGYLGAYALTALAVTLEIYYTNKTIKFVLEGLTLHTVTASSASWTNTLAFHAFVDSLNSDVLGASVTINVRVASDYRLGKLETQPIWYNISGNAATHVLKLGQGILHKIIYNNTSGTSLQIVDNITGASPSIGIITTTTAALGVGEYYVPFDNGLSIITVGNGLDATVIYE
jgi:hypothetical protein